MNAGSGRRLPAGKARSSPRTRSSPGPRRAAGAARGGTRSRRSHPTACRNSTAFVPSCSTGGKSGLPSLVPLSPARRSWRGCCHTHPPTNTRPGPCPPSDGAVRPTRAPGRRPATTGTARAHARTAGPASYSKEWRCALPVLSPPAPCWPLSRSPPARFSPRPAVSRPPNRPSPPRPRPARAWSGSRPGTVCPGPGRSTARPRRRSSRRRTRSCAGPSAPRRTSVRRNWPTPAPSSVSARARTSPNRARSSRS
ncbi:hypothetical protein GA0115250_105953 [Streptomyces sp. BvitLS-983]|nr:hypothetical protein GA0115250_105953 [Streptomyces sp. BvitLS-983]